jgi:hypothetical protein
LDIIYRLDDIEIRTKKRKEEKRKELKRKENLNNLIKGEKN